jgi:hypothetical protein
VVKNLIKIQNTVFKGGRSHRAASWLCDVLLMFASVNINIGWRNRLQAASVDGARRKISR